MSLKPVRLHNSNPSLRVVGRTVSSQPPQIPASDQVDSSHRPTLQRKRTEHDIKGEFYRCDYRLETLSVFVIGASGDLAKKKTYPSLFALYQSHYLPEEFTIVGFARSPKSDEAFRNGIRDYLAKKTDGSEAALRNVDEFLAHCIYRSASAYDDVEAVRTVADEVRRMEEETGLVANRLFYFAVPPTVFVSIADALKRGAMNHDGWSRFIVEKPFGFDLASFERLNADIAGLLEEKEVFRIDHYIGKEAVQNLLVMRFANAIFEPLWNRHHVETVVISFKEDFGTKGRGGYFDKSGIIRDVMQNHLLQVLTMFAMEAPVQHTGDFIRDEKVKVLRAMPAVKVEDCLTGQYVADDEGREEDYTKDAGVPEDSKTPTFAGLVMYIDNPRWEGVPFILRAGKALNERKSEIRVQFRKAGGSGLLFPDVHGDGHSGVERNELVIRLQPNESIYLKMNIKAPGLAGDPVLSELDLSYRTRYPDKFSRLPDAYTRLMLQVLRGDASAFVRDDELREAWRIFTPLLHAIDDGAVEPIKYKAMSRGPAEFDEMTRRFGYVFAGKAYSWHEEQQREQE